MTNTWNALRRCAYWMIPLLTALGSPACAGLPEPDDDRDDPTKSELQWTSVAPGVWERSHPRGGRERVTKGLDGLRFDIAAAEERQATLERQGPGPDVAAQIQENARFLSELRSTLEEITREKEGDAGRVSAGDEASEQPALPPPPEGEGLDPESYPYGQTTGGISGSMCNGNYSLEVTFDNQWHNHHVTASASWSEFGPFPMWIKQMSTYAWAVGGNGVPMTDADENTFSGSCCEYVSSSAAAAVTFSPQLLGSVYLTAWNGCPDQPAYTSYTRWN